MKKKAPKAKKEPKKRSLIERGSREVQRKMRFKHNQKIADAQPSIDDAAAITSGPKKKACE